MCAGWAAGCCRGPSRSRRPICSFFYHFYCQKAAPPPSLWEQSAMARAPARQQPGFWVARSRGTVSPAGRRWRRCQQCPCSSEAPVLQGWATHCCAGGIGLSSWPRLRLGGLWGPRAAAAVIEWCVFPTAICFGDPGVALLFCRVVGRRSGGWEQEGGFTLQCGAAAGHCVGTPLCCSPVAVGPIEAGVGHCQGADTDQVWAAVGHSCVPSCAAPPALLCGAVGGRGGVEAGSRMSRACGPAGN